MEILRIDWENFKSFRGKHSFDFRKYGPGLHFLRGENRAEPELGANGAAKSTIWDVVHWCLYGSSLRGVRTPQLVPWSRTGYPKASLLCKIDGEYKKITRTHRPNKLLLMEDRETRGIAQDQLESLTRLVSNTFQSSIVIGQFSPMFFDLRPADKLTLFSELMQLDYWLEKSKHADNMSKELSGEYNELNSELERLDATVEEIRRSIEEMKVEERILRVEMLGRRKEIRNAIKELKGAKRKFRKELFEQKSKLKKVKDSEKGINSDIRSAERLLYNARSELHGLDQIIGELRAGIASGKKIRGNLMEVGSKCPTCGQKIDKAHRRAELKRLSKMDKNIRSSLRARQLEYSKLEGEYKKHSDVVRDLQAQLHDNSTGLTLRRKIDELENEISGVDREIKSYDKDISNLDARNDVYLSRLNKAQDRLKSTMRSLDKKKKECQELESLIGSVKYWTRGFKDIRLFEIDETLTALELEVNNYLADLGMERWTVRLDVERETKSGNVSRGFQVMVDPGTGKNKDVKPWEVWSGGEGQRLRLAGTMALANLILRQCDLDSNIQVWDEKLYWLSGTGEDDMLGLLQETAKQSGKQIWLVDQHNLDYPFDSIVTVIKDRKGSHLVEA